MSTSASAFDHTTFSYNYPSTNDNNINATVIINRKLLHSSLISQAMKVLIIHKNDNALKAFITATEKLNLPTKLEFIPVTYKISHAL